MSGDYKQEVNRYRKDLLLYNTKKALTSATGQIGAGILSFAALTTASFNHWFPDSDQLGTDKRDAVFEQLTSQKDSLISSVNKFQDMRFAINNEMNVQSQTLNEEQDKLRTQSQVFFTNLLTNGSMMEGLDISESDANKIITDLQNNVDDFDWEKHTNARIPIIIDSVLNNPEFLDEARGDNANRYDRADTLNKRLDTAFSIAQRTNLSNKNSGGLFMFFMLCSAILSLGSAAITESLGKNINGNYRKPTPPRKPQGH